MRKLSAILCALCLMSTPVFADQPTAQFLLVGQGARALAMGESTVSSCFDYSSAYWNPAAEVFLKQPVLGLASRQLPGDITLGYISLVVPWYQSFAFSFHALGDSVGDIPSYDPYGNQISPISASEFSAGLSLAFALTDSLSIAGTVEGAGMSMGDYTSTPGVGFGGSAMFKHGRFSAGAAMENMGGKLQFKHTVTDSSGNNQDVTLGDGQPLPALTRAGVSYAVLKNSNLLLSAAIQKVDGDSTADYTGFGAEFTFAKYFALRAGFKSQNGSLMPAVGFGIDFKRVTIEFAQEFPASQMEGTETSTFGLALRMGWTPEEKAARAKQKAAEQPRKTVQYEEEQPQPVQVRPRKPGEVLPIAVSDFSGKNVSQADASIVTDFLRTELVGTQAFNVIEKANMDKILAEAAFQNSGCTTTECAVQIGKILNVRQMVVGSLSKLMDTYYITASLVEVETGRIISSYKKDATSARELNTACKILAEELANSDNITPTAPASAPAAGNEKKESPKTK